MNRLNRHLVLDSDLFRGKRLCAYGLAVQDFSADAAIDKELTVIRTEFRPQKSVRAVLLHCCPSRRGFLVGKESDSEQDAPPLHPTMNRATGQVHFAEGERKSRPKKAWSCAEGRQSEQESCG